MTLDSFGKRLGVTRATAHQIEKAEVNESITIKRLRAAADALECDLLIQIVPRQSLEELVSRRAYSLATAEVDRLNHSMLLEGQAIYDKDLDDFIAQVAESLIERKDARLWISE